MMTETITAITPEELLFLANVYEQAEKYEDMADCMKKYVTLKPDLNNEERNLLSAAYKNCIVARRYSWKAIVSIEQKQENEEEKVSKNITLIKQLKYKIEEELTAVCEDVFSVVDSVSNTNDKINQETQVFFLKMKADYYKYMCEYSTGKKLKMTLEKALENYQKASEMAEKTLFVANPIRIGLALNYSVFLYECYNQKYNAIKLARTAFDNVIARFEDIPEEYYKDSATVMLLLRDYINLWTDEL